MPAKGNPAIIAHRGASGTAPENTLSSIRRALEVGTGMVEIDVRTTEDGEIVVMHDAEVSRTTDGAGLVSNLSLGKIRSLDAGSWFAPEFQGERVPTLDEVLDLVKGQAGLCIEIKEAQPQTVIKKVVDHDYLDRVIVFDFNLQRLREARKLRKDLKTLALGISRENLGSVDPKICSHVGCPVEKLDRAFIGQVHDLHLAVFSHTVNQEAVMRKVAQLGVDGIITDFPEIAVRALRQLQP